MDQPGYVPVSPPTGLPKRKVGGSRTGSHVVPTGRADAGWKGLSDTRKRGSEVLSGDHRTAKGPTLLALGSPGEL